MFGLKRGLIAIHPELPWCPDDRTAVILQFPSMSFANPGISRVAPHSFRNNPKTFYTALSGPGAAKAASLCPRRRRI